MKRFFTLFMFLSTLLVGIQAQDVSFSVADLDIKPGEQKELEVNMENSVSVTFAQFEIDIPDGLEFVQAYDSNYSALSSERGTGQTFNDVVEGNHLTVLIEPNANLTGFNGNSGTIIKFAVRAKDDATLGKNKIKIEALVGDKDANELSNDGAIVNVEIYKDYTVTLNADEKLGKVEGGGTYKNGTEVTIKANANEGYYFTKWSNDVEENPYTFLLNADTEFTASFAPNKYVVKFMNGDTEVSSQELDYLSEIPAQDDPVKEGYTFLGWYNGDVKYAKGATVPLNGVTYTAKFSINQYNVKFIVDDKEVYNKKQDYGSAITAPKNPVKTGYTFTNWTPTVDATVPAHDVTYTAQFTINQHVVKFVADDVTVKEDTLDYGTKITVPEAPAKEGYTFAGWSEHPETMPDSDLTITGSYTINKYKLTYVIGEKKISETDVEYGEAITAIDAPEKEGYTFDGWVGVPETMPAQDVTVTGSYTINTYTLTFKIEDTVKKTCEVTYGTELSLEEYAPEVDKREGYVFSWSEMPTTMPANDVVITGTYIEDSFKLSYYDGFAEGTFINSVEMKYNADIEPIAAPNHEGYTFTHWEGMPEDLKMPAKDLTVYSKYAINSYKLTFKVDGKVVDEKTVEYNSAIVEPEVDAKEGHSFAWEEHATNMPANDLTINGAYTVNEYELTFVIGESVISTAKVAYGSAITAPDAPAKEGHTFAGWDNVPATMPANDVIVNGSYTVNTYTVVWKLDGVIFATANVHYGEALPPSPTVPEKPGFTFSGWSETPATMPANDVVITGSYVGGKFLLTWVVEGKVIRKDSVDYDMALPAAPVVEDRTGHSFTWSGIVEKMPAHDVVVTGAYSINTYAVRYYLEGELFKEIAVVYNTVIPDYPKAPEKEGHIFMGWDRQPKLMPANDVEVTGYYIRAYTHVANNKYQTLSLDFDADIPSGVTVYSATLSDDEKYVILTKEDIDVLPKNTAVVIKAYTSEYIFVESIYNPDKLSGKNILKPTGDGSQTLISLRLTEAYMIGNNANGELSFCKYTSSKPLSANQGYFEWKSNKTAPASLVIDDGTTTNINGISDNNEDAVYYDLSGRRINKTNGTHGVVIRKSAMGNKAIVR